MKKNVGGWDKILRIIIGLIISIAGIYYKNPWGLIGVLILITGVVGWCGLYKILKISTAKNTEIPGENVNQ